MTCIGLWHEIARALADPRPRGGLALSPGSSGCKMSRAGRRTCSKADETACVPLRNYEVIVGVLKVPVPAMPLKVATPSPMPACERAHSRNRSPLRCSAFCSTHEPWSI